MPARKTAPRLGIDISSPGDEITAKFVRGSTPWIVWLGGIPLACAVSWLVAWQTHQRVVVTAGLAVVTVVVTKVTTRKAHGTGRGRAWEKIHHGLNSFVSLSIVTLVTWQGPMAWHGALLAYWFVLGLAGCLVWNIRYTSHEAGAEDVLVLKRHRDRKRVDLAYLIRVVAGRAPVVRSVAEKTGKVIPAVVGPWREAPKMTEPAAVQKAITAGDHVDAADAEAAQRMWLAIRRNWRDLQAHKVPELNGARIKLVGAPKPWRITTEIVLIRGVQTPKVVTDARELLASQNALPLSSILIRANPRDHHRVFADFVLEDVLATVRHWPGPSAVGSSIGEAPIRFGIYEDRAFAESWETAISAEMAVVLGVPEQNLAHPISEGMTGAGKSTYVRIVIADGSSRRDVVDWAIDPVKQYQTLGCVAGALDWFAVTKGEGSKMIRFLADAVIPERANYLGMHGYDGWEPGCGLPFLRTTIEEGNIIANELDKLPDVLNSARSAGVKIRASFQRAHHAVVDTNARAAFGETLSFGVKSSDDIFVMDDELREAGADPSLWQDKQPGMLFRSAKSVPFDRQLMAVRCFKAEAADCERVVAEHAARRDAQIAADFPDWAEMLARLDANHWYEQRTTGAAVRQQMDATAQRKAARITGAPLPEAATAPAADERLSPDDEIVEAELVPSAPDPARASWVPDYPPDDDYTEEPVSMDELDLPEELRLALEEDEDIDPSQPIPPEDPAADFSFGRPRGREMPRDDALRLLRSHLMGRGDGWEFAPRDLYEDLCPATGRSAGWIRTEVSTTLVAEGLVEHDQAEGRYQVTLTAGARS